MRAKRGGLLTAVAAMIVLFGVTAGSGSPQTTSETCLACHGGAAGPTIRSAGSHAYGIDYEAARAGRRWLRPSTAPSGFGSTIAKDLLVHGRVECTTCHTPHEEPNEHRYRLRYEQRPATLCMTCHDMSRL